MATEKNSGQNDDQPPQVEPEEAAPEPAAPPSTEGAGPRPGVIPEPKERPWDAEPADPYEGIDRSDPFEGRPRTAVPQPEELRTDDEDPFVDPGPGQPLPQGSKGGSGE